jgi:acetyl/propionyl-CoA carboxylase alpha subunit
MAQITAQQKKIEIVQESDQLFVDGSKEVVDLQKIDGKINMLFKGHSYNIEVLKKDAITGKMILKINNRVIETHLQNSLHLLLQKLGMNQSKKKQNEIKAPMPGLVLDILVAVGNEVNEGDILIVLEAMKMENAIKSPQSGIVEQIIIDKGQTVDKSQLMIRLK